MGIVERMVDMATKAKTPTPWGADEHTTYLGNNNYLINAHVDSQNGFGAMIRNKFICTVISQDSGKTWNCKGCVLQEELE